MSAPCIQQLPALSGYSTVDGSPFIPTTAARRHMKSESSTSGHTMTPLFFYSANFRFSAPFQWFNLVALLDFNNFIGAIWLKLWRHKRVIGGLWRSQKICIRHITAASFTTWAYEKIFEKFGPQRVMWCNYKVWPLAKVGFQTWRSSWRAPSTVSFSHIPLIMWSVCFFF